MAIEVKRVDFYDNGRIYATVEVKTYEDGRVEIVPPDGYRMYPMNIETADTSAHSFVPELIRMWWKGSRRYKCYMVPVLEELFNAMMRPDWSEDKRNLRSHKCRVEGAHGTPIICRRASCTGCPNVGKDMETNQTSYIEDLKKNSNWEPATEDITSTEAILTRLPVRLSQELQLMRSSPCVRSGLSSTSAHLIPVMWKEM